jgi:hypothetical protein
MEMKPKQKPYHLLAFEKAMDEGRVMIDNRDGKEHRRFNITLRPSQVAKSFKDCLNKNELDDYSEKELILIAKKVIDLLIKRNSINSDILYRHFRGRLEKFYKERTKNRRRGI